MGVTVLSLLLANCVILRSSDSLGLYFFLLGNGEDGIGQDQGWLPRVLDLV